MLGAGNHAADDLIAAVATPPGPAARAVVRLCGAEIHSALAQLWRPAAFDTRSGVWEEGQGEAEEALAAVARPMVLPGWAKIDAAGRCISCTLCYWPDTRSFTRMPLAEIHLLGSDPIVQALIEQACRHGARLARGGEFTLRAFLGGRIDLTQAEAVLGVIESRSARECEVALKQLAGGLSGPLLVIRESLLELLAEIEAGLDFADEEIDAIEDAVLDQRLHQALEQTTSLLWKIKERDKTSTSGRVVLLGRPNAGKSSLFNCLTGGAALESPEPGTTRDYLARPLQLDGMQCELIDTAGVAGGDPDRVIPDANPAVDRQAHAMTRAQSESASLKVLCLDVTASISGQELEAVRLHRQAGGLVVMTKCDLATLPANAAELELQVDVFTSSRTGAGLENLRILLRDRLTTDSVVGQAVVSSTAARCRESVKAAADSVAEAIGLLQTGSGHELLAAEVRIALDALGEVSGAIYTDDMLDRIFSKFCIGK